MNKILTVGILIVGMLIFTQSNTLAQEGDFKLGAGLAFGSGVFEGGMEMDDIQNDLGIGVDGYYSVTSDIRVGGDFLFYFPKTIEESGSFGGEQFSSSLTATVWELNINGNYMFVQQADLNFYGLAGINITGVSQKYEESGGGMSESDSESDSETGLNLGAGIEYALDFGDLFGELKLGNLGGDANQFVLGAGIRFGL